MLDVVVLGATGSVGESTLDVIARHPDHYQVYALTANRSVDTMVTLCLRHRPTYAVMMDPEAAQLLASRLAEHCDTKVLDGEALPSCPRVADGEAPRMGPGLDLGEITPTLPRNYRGINKNLQINYQEIIKEILSINKISPKSC